MVDLSGLERIYVRLPNWVGDVVLATPFLRALRRAAPRATIAAHGRGAAFKILANEGLYDRELGLQKGGLLWPLREGKRVRAELGELDLAVLLPNSVSSAMVAWSAGARQRLGYRLNGRGALLTAGPVVRKEGLLRPVPMVDYYLGLLEHLGVDTSDEPRRPILTPSPEAEDRVEELLTRLELNAPSIRRWALNLGGSWETKRWIPQYAGELVRRIRRAGAAPILLRGPDEGELAEAVCEAAGERVPGADDVVGLTELTALMRRCEVLITSDSGPRHFGVAAQIPVLVLIGSTHPHYTTVDHRGLELLSEWVDCWPCHLKTCPLDFRCMRALTPARVQRAAEALVERERLRAAQVAA